MNVNRKNLIKNHFKVFIFLISFSLIRSNIKEKTSINYTIHPYISDDNKIWKESTFGNYLEIIFGDKETVEIKIDEILNISFLSYEVIPNYGKVHASIYDENKVFNVSNKNENNILNSKFYIYKKFNNNKNNNYEVENINSYKSYFYTYNIKKETDRKKILQIKCEQGLLNGTNKICVSKVNVYTENDRINMSDPNIKDLPLFKCISKNNRNKYFFANNFNDINLNIEVFSGNITAELMKQIK